jgi:hypothetical protein
MIQKYTKKPVTIEAIQWTKGTMDEVLTWMPSNRVVIRVLGMEENPYESLKWTYEYFIQTLEGEMKISEGDYIIKGVKGEFYPCKPDIFEATYDKVYVTEEQDPILELKEMDQDPTIKFMTKGPEEVIRITKGKFYFKGEEVEDKYQVYERFNDWMTMIEEPVSKPTLKDLKFNETKIDNINW